MIFLSLGNYVVISHSSFDTLRSLRLATETNGYVINF